MKKVNFKSNNLNVVANMYFPENFDENNQYPAIVVNHPAGGVKEQTAGLYAERLATLGYVTMAYDASYQGESEGQPHNLENPSSRVEDVRAAVDYFNTLDFIDDSRIGALGICAGGGYTIKAAQTEKRIKAVVGISAADIGQNFRKGWTGNQDEKDINPLLEQVAEQRKAEANGAPQKLVGFVPEEPTEDMDQETKDGWEYYRTPRAQHERSINQFPFISFDRIIEFTAFDLVDKLLTQPVLFIAGSEAGTLWQSENAYERALEPKDIHIVEGANHFDMYDKEPFVTEAVEKMNSFYGQYL
ncbi:TPA: alpha/beta hydrolase [Staphylococcus aureus]|uniref:Alpha/beta fold hydrolase n=2 Tax=Staphylococcus aureus TaxID=1280 RepID=A0A0U1MVT9_STAAU|nr:alpha/beta hydrolase [Staphylococcus aureus]HDH6294999.1 alpha/beta hydrolase [Staphylococcus aureus LTCF-1-17]HDK8976724.1 alpha/beta hydrolase [Staphylococcus aureus USA600-NRS22]HDK9079767.1 alpha/beta hydrolase [Staphylococcus aureus USA600-BAA1754]HDK9083041.1 alpha/beta hydrolase [Staphylococcus aureus USA600-BAA1751]HDQ3542207.1 alpha/beta hydrolase [Staphylococcus aureus USA600-NY-315]